MRPGDPLTKQRSPWTPVENAGPFRWHHRNVSDGVLYAAISDDPIGPGETQLHMSISFRDQKGEPRRYPTWDEIAHARYELLPHDLDFVMHLPPPDEFVAVHPTTFHLHESPKDRRTP